MNPTPIYSMRDIERLHLEIILQLGYSPNQYEHLKPHFDVMMHSLEKSSHTNIDEQTRKEWWHSITQYIFLEVESNSDEFDKLSQEARDRYLLLCMGKAMIEVLP